MNLREALAEFASLLEVASGSLKAIIENESAPADKAAHIDEVIQIAGRLREISETVL